MLSDKIDETIRWLVEERFIRKLGIDDDYVINQSESDVDGVEKWTTQYRCGQALLRVYPGLRLQNKVNWSHETKPQLLQ